MKLNPYESPREQGYQTPEETVNCAYRRDTLYLLLSAIAVWVVIVGIIAIRLYFNAQKGS
jgi:hypothetical protein